MNQQAKRIAATVDGGPSRAAISRHLAKAILAGQETTTAVFTTQETVKQMPSVILDIDEVPDVQGGEVNISGEIVELWTPSAANIAQVGLIADKSGAIKFTSWSKSDQPLVEEGDQVQLWHAKKNGYQGRCSLALTYDSRIEFPERTSWW